MAGLYLHIPFCKQACYYCDFHFSTNQDLRKALVDALCAEMRLQHSYLHGARVDTVYLGGGTPSILSHQEMVLLFETIRSVFEINEHAEITMEVNPDDLSIDHLRMIKSLGVNRLSIGVQSFFNPVLEFFNRAHRAEEAVEAIERARAEGFSNISLDLIYGVPGQDMMQWEKNLAQLLELHPEHISAYALTIEESTVLGRWQQRDKFTPMSEALVADQFEVLMDTLDSSGYDHYEISNFAKPGFLSKHNSSYWRQEPYLGIGPSAHSYDRVSRQFNIRNNALYIKALERGAVPFEREVLTWQNHVNEYLMTSLRTSWGCDLGYLKNQHGFTFPEDQQHYLRKLQEEGYLDYSESRIVLLRKGKLLADKIAGDLFVLDDSKMANFRP